MILKIFSLQNRLAGWMNPLRSVFFLVLRLYWGSTLAVAGWNKLLNLGGTAGYFEGLGLPLPMLNALVAGGAEFVGGIFLVLGLLSRPVGAVLTFNFIIAYIFGHPDAARALFTNPAEFIGAAAFSYLFVSLLILLAGPGRFSLDALIETKLGLPDRASSGDIAATGSREPAASASVADAPGGVSRRNAVGLAAAVVGGLVAGAALPRLTGGRSSSGKGESDGSASAGEETTASAGDAVSGEGDPIDIAGNADLQQIDADAAEGVVPTELLREPHTCCGLNTCAGLGKSGDNACAGQGTCASAETHVCQGLNSCKGQGGRGEYPGQNSCDGKGACAVPLQKKQWQLARKRFEELMEIAGRPVGGPPAECKHAAG